eukprot:tig00000430_g612.t1
MSHEQRVPEHSCSASNDADGRGASASSSNFGEESAFPAAAVFAEAASPAAAAAAAAAGSELELQDGVSNSAGDREGPRAWDVHDCVHCRLDRSGRFYVEFPWRGHRFSAYGFQFRQEAARYRDRCILAAQWLDRRDGRDDVGGPSDADLSCDRREYDGDPLFKRLEAAAEALDGIDGKNILALFEAVRALVPVEYYDGPVEVRPFL